MAVGNMCTCVYVCIPCLHISLHVTCVRARYGDFESKYDQLFRVGNYGRVRVGCGLPSRRWFFLNMILYVKNKSKGTFLL
jgi:hypothetical protein